MSYDEDNPGWPREPDVCPYCMESPCRCEPDERSIDEKMDRAAEWRDKWADQDGNYPEDDDIDF